jgi:hypothetical protein
MPNGLRVGDHFAAKTVPFFAATETIGLSALRVRGGAEEMSREQALGESTNGWLPI